jgi:hypothetical protein
MNLETPFRIVIALGILSLGLGFAEEPFKQETQSARSEGRAKATTGSSTDSGQAAQPRANHKRERPSADRLRGDLPSEVGASRRKKPSVRLRAVPQVPRAFEGIAPHNPQIQSIAPNTSTLAQAGSGKLSGAVKNEPKNATQTHQPAASLVQRSASTLPVNAVHVEGVGGHARPLAQSSAAINGTGFKHRP